MAAEGAVRRDKKRKLDFEAEVEAEVAAEVEAEVEVKFDLVSLPEKTRGDQEAVIRSVNKAAGLGHTTLAAVFSGVGPDFMRRWGAAFIQDANVQFPDGDVVGSYLSTVPGFVSSCVGHLALLPEATVTPIALQFARVLATAIDPRFILEMDAAYPKQPEGVRRVDAKAAAWLLFKVCPEYTAPEGFAILRRATMKHLLLVQDAKPATAPDVVRVFAPTYACLEDGVEDKKGVIRRVSQGLVWREYTSEPAMQQAVGLPFAAAGRTKWNYRRLNDIVARVEMEASDKLFRLDSPETLLEMLMGRAMTVAEREDLLVPDARWASDTSPAQRAWSVQGVVAAYNKWAQMQTPNPPVATLKSVIVLDKDDPETIARIPESEWVPVADLHAIPFCRSLEWVHFSNRSLFNCVHSTEFSASYKCVVCGRRGLRGVHL